MNNLTPEQTNQLLKYAIGGYWSALQEKLIQLELNNIFNSSELRQELSEIRRYQDRFQAENQSLTNPHMIADYMRTKEENRNLKESLSQKEAELTTERETTQQALTTSQEWHERQKAEIIEQWKSKLQTFIDKRKTQLQTEITLIKEVLNE